MSKVVFYNMPLYAHTIQTFPLIQELVNRGEEVIFHTNERFRDSVELTGAEYREYLGEYSSDPSRMIWDIDKYMPKVRDIILQELESYQNNKPDYIIYDYLAVWAAVLAESANLPSICIHPSIILNMEVLSIQPKFSMLKRIVSKPHRIPYAFKVMNANRFLMKVKMEFSYSGYFLPAADADLVLVNVSRDFQPFPDSIDERFKFIGLTDNHEFRKNEGAFPWDRISSNKLVYISLGTTFNRNNNFYDQCFDAFRNVDCQVVISTGGSHHVSLLDNVPDNFILSDWVPQLEILKRADVFVNQGGTSSVSESIVSGCPVVVVPQSAEQPIIGYWVERLEIGKNISGGRLSADTLRSAVGMILADQKYTRNCIKYSESFNNAGGEKSGADEIFKMKEQFGIK